MNCVFWYCNRKGLLRLFLKNIQLSALINHLINMLVIRSYIPLSSRLYLNRFVGRHCRDRMVVGFATTCAIRAYHHTYCEFEPRSRRGVLDTTLCNKVFQ
jgi:hypothetical protein